MLSNKLIAYAHLMRWHRPIGTLLLLWPTLWALWIATAGHPPLKLVLIFIAGTFVMRSAGCIINDFADRNFDGLVTRTKSRPLVTGAVSVKEALVLFGLLGIIAFLLVLQLNLLTVALALVGLVLAIIYPFMKRFTHWPQLVLGMAFAWSIPMAFSAALNQLPAITWWIYAAGVIWPLMYDTQYAMTDRQDDLQIGLKSTAIVFGRYDRIIILLLQLVVLGLLCCIGSNLHLDLLFFLGLLAAIALFGYQQYLIKEREPAKCFKAFLNNQWVGLVIFLGIVASYT